MREPTIARNYAEALFEVGERKGHTERFADLIDALASAIEEDERIHIMLESPRVPKDRKHAILAAAFEKHAPAEFVAFLGAVIKRGRQGILGTIATQYLALVDDKFNRVHAGVTVAREPDRALQAVIKKRLSEVIGKDVIPHFRTDPEILGGMIVRIDDRIMDGSLRRKMVALRRQLLMA